MTGMAKLAATGWRKGVPDRGNSKYGGPEVLGVVKGTGEPVS